MLRRTQITLTLLHTVVLTWAIWNVAASAPGALYQSAWFVLFWPDLPATAILVASWVVVPDSVFGGADAVAASLFRDLPWSSVANFWLPFLLYATIGTWWWYALPKGVWWLLKTMRRKHRPNATE